MSKVTEIQELRRSNAASAIPSRKRRRKMTRKAKREAAIEDQKS